MSFDWKSLLPPNLCEDTFETLERIFLDSNVQFCPAPLVSSGRVELSIQVPHYNAAGALQPCVFHIDIDDKSTTDIVTFYVDDKLGDIFGSPGLRNAVVFHLILSFLGKMHYFTESFRFFRACKSTFVPLVEITAGLCGPATFGAACAADLRSTFYLKASKAVEYTDGGVDEAIRFANIAAMQAQRADDEIRARSEN